MPPRYFKRAFDLEPAQILREFYADEWFQIEADNAALQSSIIWNEFAGEQEFIVVQYPNVDCIWLRP